MPTGQLYPPHKLPDLDQLLINTEALHNVTITTAEPGSSRLNINATTTHPTTGEQIPLAIRWQFIKWHGDALLALMDQRLAPYDEGRVDAASLGLDRNTRDSAVLWAAFVELREAYRQAHQFHAYSIAKLDNTARYNSRPSKAHATRIRERGTRR
jgi:hypothetical protein